MSANNSKITTTQIDELRHFIYNDIGRIRYVDEIMTVYVSPNGWTERNDRLFFRGKGACRRLRLKDYSDETLSEIIRMTEEAIKHHAESPKKYIGTYYYTYQKTPEFLWHIPNPIKLRDDIKQEDGSWKLEETGEIYYPQMITTTEQLEQARSEHYGYGRSNYKIWDHRMKIINNALAKFKQEEERRAK